MTTARDAAAPNSAPLMLPMPVTMPSAGVLRDQVLHRCGGCAARRRPARRTRRSCRRRRGRRCSRARCAGRSRRRGDGLGAGGVGGDGAWRVAQLAQVGADRRGGRNGHVGRRCRHRWTLRRRIRQFQQHVARLDAFAGPHTNREHLPGSIGAELVLHLHRLDDQQWLVRDHAVALRNQHGDHRRGHRRPDRSFVHPLLLQRL